MNASIELTLFGRAALSLGFPGHSNYARTVDVDVILATGQAEILLQSTNFWEIVEKLNEHYAAEGLYMTHFFEESQVVLRTDWLTGRIVLPRTFHNIKLTGWLIDSSNPHRLCFLHIQILDRGRTNGHGLLYEPMK